MKPLVAAVLVALAVGCAAQTPEFDALRARAEQGDAEAQFNLGVMYAAGRAVPQDDAEAVRWYRLAAEQGPAQAQRRLGLMYFRGRSVPQDGAEAVRWWRLAAEQGDAYAQRNLGIVYDRGRGVPQDDVRAHMWLNLAVSGRSGNTRLSDETRELAVQNRDLVAGRMTPDDRSEAQRLAREWDAAHPTSATHATADAKNRLLIENTSVLRSCDH